MKQLLLLINIILTLLLVYSVESFACGGTEPEQIEITLIGDAL